MLSEWINTLSKQVQLDFMRTMNKITFDKIITLKPEKFAYVQPQPVDQDVVPETGMMLLFLLF